MGSDCRRIKEIIVMEETDKSIMAFLEDKFKNIENRMIGID